MKGDKVCGRERKRERKKEMVIIWERGAEDDLPKSLFITFWYGGIWTGSFASQSRFRMINVVCNCVCIFLCT